MSRLKKYKLDESHLEQYKNRVLYWLGKMGISGWSVYFEMQDSDDSFSSLRWNYHGRVCTFCLTERWDLIEPCDHIIDRTALHECLHLLMAPLDACAKDRYASEAALDNAHEKVVVMLENFILDGPCAEKGRCHNG